MLTELFRLVIRGERGESKPVELAAHHLPHPPSRPPRVPPPQRRARSPSPRKRRGSGVQRPVKRGSSFNQPRSCPSWGDHNVPIDDQMLLWKQRPKVS